MNIIFCCTTNEYPKGFSANNTKIGLWTEGIYEISPQTNISIINKPNRNQVIRKNSILSLKHATVYDVKNSDKYFSKLRSLIRILKQIRHLKKESDNFLLFSEEYFHIFIFIFIISKILGYKVGYIFHEWHVGFKVSPHRKIDFILRDYLFPRLCDFVLPISEYLIKRTQKKNQNYLKMPILGNFDGTKEDVDYRYKRFVYCASIAYIDVLKLIIRAFELFNDMYTNYQLVLILYGPNEKINEFKRGLSMSSIKDKVIIKTGVSDDELKHIYMTSSALLIPLNPENVTEKARFSQKVAEYLSSKTVIISTPVGDMAHYFSHKKDVIFTEYNAESISSAMRFIEEFPNECRTIGLNGFITGKKYFSYTENAKTFIDFLNSQK